MKIAFDAGSDPEAASNRGTIHFIPDKLTSPRQTGNTRFRCRFRLAARTGTRHLDRLMPTIAIVFGILLSALGLGAYVGTGSHSVTALIPAFLGAPILLAGIFPKARMHVMHVAALLGLLGTAGGLGMGLPKLQALMDGTAERPFAVSMQLGMGVISLLFLAFCVKSFIDARRARKA
jgi:hypothetical protein